MPAQFRTVCRARGLSPGDFPDLKKFVAVAKEVDFAQFPRCRLGVVVELELELVAALASMASS